MSELLALDVAILPPPDVAARARELNASLARGHDDALVLDATHLPHITLTQQFIRVEELEPAFERIDEILGSHPPLRLAVSGGGQSGHTVWMTVDRDPVLVELHERLMEALRGFERPAGGPGAFVEGEGRVGDVAWVGGYRLRSSFGHYTPHITLGPGAEPPRIEPFSFMADTVAACHLGRHCSCRRVLRQWTLA